VRLIRKGRGDQGEVVRVELIPLTAHAVELIDATGRCFLQQLGDGHATYALRGVEGSR
jgi:hypothetical protein